MANITLYKHGELEICLELTADDSIINFKEVGCIQISETYRGLNDEEFNRMAKELETLLIQLNDISKSERELVTMFIDFISYWDDHYNTYIIDNKDELNKWLNENGEIDENCPYVFTLNGFYIYDEI